MLLEQTQRSGNYLSVKRGALCLESKEPKEGYEYEKGEVNGRPYEKYVKKFAGVKGTIVKVEWYDREHNGDRYKGLHITLKDGGERYILDLPFEKRAYDYFTKIAENIDYSKPVTFEAWLDVKGAKNGGQIPTAFVCKQDDQFVQWKYTRDDMGDCPPAVQRASGKWNFDDQRDWLLERIQKYVIPHVNELHAFNEPEDDYGDAYEPPQFAGSHSANEPPYFPPSSDDMPDYVAEASEARNAAR